MIKIILAMISPNLNYGYYIEDGYTFVNTYSSKLVKRNKKVFRIYPYLVPTKIYTEYLGKLKEGDKK